MVESGIAVLAGSPKNSSNLWFPFVTRPRYRTVETARRNLRQHACYGLAEAVFEQGRWNGANLLRSPFGRLVETILKLMLH
jgi:hypothetical protein